MRFESYVISTMTKTLDPQSGANLKFESYVISTMTKTVQKFHLAHKLV